MTADPWERRALDAEADNRQYRAALEVWSEDRVRLVERNDLLAAVNVATQQQNDQLRALIRDLREVLRGVPGEAA